MQHNLKSAYFHLSIVPISIILKVPNRINPWKCVRSDSRDSLANFHRICLAENFQIILLINYCFREVPGFSDLTDAAHRPCHPSFSFEPHHSMVWATPIRRLIIRSRSMPSPVEPSVRPVQTINEPPLGSGRQSGSSGSVQTLHIRAVTRLINPCLLAMLSHGL